MRFCGNPADRTARELTLGILPLLILSMALTFAGRSEAGPYAALVAEIDSERVLYERNADELRHPASLTKMMTLYLVFEALANGQADMNTPLSVSRFAVLRPPSRLGIKEGDTLTVEQGILALVTRSANDAAAVIAENFAGTEAVFAALMTEKARQLGMEHTLFRNASGLPDPNQVTTARDMFRLGKALNKNFPQYYGYFSTNSFYFDGRSFHNHNHLLKNYPGTDGIKTGFVNASGFNLVASARRNGHRLIGVVFGGTSAAVRDAHMREILDDGFAQLEGAPPVVHRVSFDPPQPPSLLEAPRTEERKGSNKKVKVAQVPAGKTRDQGDRHDQAAAKGKSSWQIRIGEYPKEQLAKQKLSQAFKSAPFPLRKARAAVSAQTRQGKKIYLASFKGLTQEDANLACQTLRRKGLACSAAQGSG